MSNAGDPVCVEATGLHKAFSRELWRSLCYGMRDVVGECTGLRRDRTKLRAGEFWAVQDVSLKVARGECLGLIGRNGSGKTTILRMLSGLIKPDAGEAQMRGRVASLIALGAGFNPVLTGRENVYVNAAVLGLRRQEVRRRIEQVLEFAELQDAADAPVMTYSSGMQVRLGFAITTALEPDVLLVDEVLAVGDAPFRMRCFDHMMARLRAGTAMVLVSHNMVDISRMCARVMVQQQGRTRFVGETAAGIRDYARSLSDQRPGVAGGGEAWIDGVELCAADGQACQSFQTGDELRVRMRLNSPGACRELRVVVAVWSSGLGKLGALSSFLQQGMVAVEGRREVELIVPRLPLLQGYYWINLALYGPRISDLYQSVDAAGSFEIAGPPVNYFGLGVSGDIWFDHHWRLDGSSEGRV